MSTNISCGIYLLTPPVFDYIRPVFLAHHSNGDAIDEIWFERDVIPQLSADGKCFVHKSDAFWSQVKTAGSAVYANRHYLATLRKTTPDLLSSNAVVTGDVTIHKTATVDDTAKVLLAVAVRLLLRSLERVQYCLWRISRLFLMCVNVSFPPPLPTLAHLRLR